MLAGERYHSAAGFEHLQAGMGEAWRGREDIASAEMEVTRVRKLDIQARWGDEETGWAEEERLFKSHRPLNFSVGAERLGFLGLSPSSATQKPFGPV